VPHSPPYDATITSVEEQLSGPDQTNADPATGMPAGRGYGGRQQAPAEKGERQPLRRWVEEGAERPMSIEELCDYLDRCPESAD
jgi:hypothetical protein